MTKDGGPRFTDGGDPVAGILHPVRGQLAAAMGLAGTGQVLTLVPLAGIAVLAQQVLGGAAEPGAFWRVAVVCVICLSLGGLLTAAGEAVAHFADHRLTRILRQCVVRRLEQMPLGWFSDRTSGTVKQAMQDDIGVLHELTAHHFTTRARCISAIGVSVLYLFVLDWRLAGLSLLPFPGFYLLFGRARRAISEERMRGFAEGQAEINSAVVDLVHGLPVLKTFGAVGQAGRSYSQAVDHFVRAFLAFTQPLVLPLANANALIAPVTVLGVTAAAGAVFVGLGWSEPTDILPFALIAPGLCGPLMLMGFQAHGIAHATGAAGRLQTLLQTPVLPYPAPDQAEVPTGSEIRFEGVSHTYAGGTGGVRAFSLTVTPGSITAIVGPSGAGKSTLARLLLRFFDPEEGRITCGGVDLRQMTAATLYRQIGFVLQDVQLVQASLRDNIALGNPSATLEDIMAAARVANIHDRIQDLPRGYETVVGTEITLSGGEAQRVSIARAVLMDAPVLVLDEATAAVDAEAEGLIQSALSRFASGRTVVVIAHRLDTIQQADRIVVLQDGQICEEGTHQALLDRNGPYAQAWRAGGYDRASVGEGV